MRARIYLGRSRPRDQIELVIDEEGARYIADVMESEYFRTHDSGARDIRDDILNVLDEPAVVAELEENTK